MSLESWIAFCITETVLCFTPGPAVLLIVSVALRRGARPALGAATGVVAANTLYFALSATGVAALLLASRELFLAVKWAGAAYLVWLGLRMLLSRGEPTVHASGDTLRRSFLRGFLVQGANPKAIAFFVALLPQFLDPTRPLAPQVLLLGASSVVIEYAALFSYAVAASGAGRVAGPRVARSLERIGGALLVGAGARLATVRSD